MEPTFFATPEDFRTWLEAHHDTRTRERRLEQLIEDSAAGRTIRSLTRPSERRASGAGPA